MESVKSLHTVQKEDLAYVVKSGDLPVLATPVMIAWMEEAALSCLELEEGQSSVGIWMAVSHDAPTPQGGQVEVIAILKEMQKRIAVFEVSAFYNGICIGKGEHKRAVINVSRFLEKAGIKTEEE